MKMRWISPVFASIIILTLSASASGAVEKTSKNEIKDKTVQTLMHFAYGLMPEAYTGPDGKKIKIDKTNQKQVMIPIDDARRIVRVAYRSAKAQNCDLKIMQTLNHNAMVKYETVFKTWTTQQKLFINQLHLFTVLYLTGNVKVQDTETAKKEIELRKKKKMAVVTKSPYTCSEKERTLVTKSVDDYLLKVKKAIGEELERRKKLGSKQKKNETIRKAEK